MNVGQIILSCACRDCIAATAYDMRAGSLLPRAVETGLQTRQRQRWGANLPAKAQHCTSAAVGFPEPDTPVQVVSVILGKLQHWAGSAHVASPVAGE